MESSILLNKNKRKIYNVGILDNSKTIHITEMEYIHGLVEIKILGNLKMGC